MAKYFCIANIVVNLFILGLFKYYNFFVTSFVALFSHLGIELHHTVLQLILPVGISFYTFQALSYSIDVYKGRIRATHDIVSFFAFISFFPQLVAGPIERATNLLPQFQRKRIFKYEEATDGMRLILWGLFKKLIIADNCAEYVDLVFNNYETSNGSVLALAGIFFAFQIYGDFSGYSDIAIGTAKLFGIRLRDNFKTPYFSRDIAEFWKRWHISLNKWFVDYVYIPLGGSRVNKMMVVRNIFIIFLLSGLWHGANWTYLVWGLYHAILFLPLILLNLNKRYKDIVAFDTMLPSCKEGISMLITFVLVTIGWIIFRAENISVASEILTKIFQFDLWERPYIAMTYRTPTLLCIVFLFFMEWINRKRNHGLDLSWTGNHKWIRLFLYYSIFCLIVLYSGKNITFIYFQF